MAYLQANRRIAISTPLGDDALLLRGFTGNESVSKLFHFDLELLSEDDAINFEELVGKNVTVRIFGVQGAKRSWNGIISRFSQGARDRRLTSYHAQMVPWLWFLTRTADCRIFQNKKVPDIIQTVFHDLGFHDFELRLFGAFTPREYCVQYRETDFNFISRLMEEEGICYYFRHEEGKHVLVLANDQAAHKPSPEQENARYAFRVLGGSPTEDVITAWLYEAEVRPGSWSQTDYNFEAPGTSLAVSVKGSNPFEIYDYPGKYLVRSEGDRLARIRLQEKAAAAVVSRGEGGCRHFAAGCSFNLTGHYRSELDQAYLLTSVQHTATQGGDYANDGGEGDELDYQNAFECIPLSTPFRPRRETPAPFVQGCQTAVVVGPAGQEIYTDPHGRVKVQFHWDREGQRNENSSCWIRVSHPWAGKGWGSISIPRVGQEVIVDFLEGNPDQPIITGRVYNADHMPPNGLPASAMVSGLKSNSTPGGGGYNELSMDDTKGKEKVTIHAQYNMGQTIENDLSTLVKAGNRTLTVHSGTNTEIVKGNSSHTVQAGSRTVTVTGGDYSATSTDAAVFLHGQGKGVLVQGDVEGVGIIGNAKGVGIIGNGQGVGIVGNGTGVAITGNDQGVLITGNAQGVGIIGNAKGVGIQGKGEGVVVSGEPFVGIEGASFVKITAPSVEIGDGEITIKGKSIVLSAGTGQITIGSSGVDIVGAMVRIN